MKICRNKHGLHPSALHPSALDLRPPPPVRGDAKAAQSLRSASYYTTDRLTSDYHLASCKCLDHFRGRTSDVHFDSSRLRFRLSNPDQRVWPPTRCTRWSERRSHFLCPPPCRGFAPDASRRLSPCCRRRPVLSLAGGCLMSYPIVADRWPDASCGMKRSAELGT